MQTPVNQFKKAIAEKRTQYGLWVSLMGPLNTEICAAAGFDWILLDAEHAPNDVLTLVPQLMALKDSVSAPVVRPPSNDVVVIKRLLDAGFHNFLVPFVENADEARRAVAATRYPPAGVRGVSVSQRSNRYGSVPDYFRIVNDTIAVMVQIESRAGVSAAASIASVDGVDGLFIGPSDLAAAYGYLGAAGHPEVQDAMAEIFAASRTAGKPVGILAPVEADARRYMALGASFVAVGSDLGVLRMASQALSDKFRDPGAMPVAAQY